MALDLLNRLNRGGPDPRREFLWLMVQEWQAPPELQRTHRELIQTGEVMAALTPRGWAPTSQCPVPGYVAAHPYVTSGEFDRAEELVVEGWETSGLLPGNLVRVKGFGSYLAWDLVGEARYLIVEEAWRLHVDGCHVASIPLVLAQVEGICIDATGGRPFFSKGANRADLTDAVTLAGHDRALGVVRDLFSVDVKTTESTGDANWGTAPLATRGRPGSSYFPCGNGRVSG